MAAPRVSVVMAAYNESACLARSIASILAQTLSDFELIVVDDGSTDGTAEILSNLKDPRIITLTHKENRGMAESRNAGVRAARGRYIAVQDADDISVPERLKRQARFLDDNPDISLCGAWGRMLSEGREPVEFQLPTSPEHIRASLVRTNPILDATVMARASVLKENPYDTTLARLIDHDLFLRLGRDHKMANLPEILVDFETSQSWSYQLREQCWKTRIRWRALTRYGYPLSEALWLLAPLPVLLLPAGIKQILRRRFLLGR